MRISAPATLVAAAVLVLSGCAADPKPTFDPTPSSTPSSTSSSPTAQPQSAEDFIRDWVQLHTEMQNTGDTAAFRNASTGCGACTKLADLVDRVYARGGSIKTGGWTIRTLTRQAANQYKAEIRSAATTYTKRAGGRSLHLPAGAGTELFILQKRGATWVMSDISEVAQ